MTTITITKTIALSADEARAELARREHNRAARKDETLDRIEPTSDDAFRASKDDLLAIVAADDATPSVPSLGYLSSDHLDPKIRAAAENAGILVGYEVFADSKYLTCTHECGGCVNGELCDAVVERALAGDASISAYGSPSVSNCRHGGECADLAGR